MVTPFEVYLVLQLDVMIRAAFVFGLICALGGSIGAIHYTTEAGKQWAWDKEPPESRISRFASYTKIAKRFACAGLFSLAVSVFLPSTRTAAAMILLPALTSKEVTAPLSREAGELYELAKSALRNASNKPEPKQEPSK